MAIHGRAECQCYPGYRLAYDRRSCVDVDECAASAGGQGGCEHDCHNVQGTYECTCRRGYRLLSDGRTCERVVDEGCALANGGCQHSCHEVGLAADSGTAVVQCSCRAGFRLDPHDHRTCHGWFKALRSLLFHADVNECESATTNGGCSHVCVNLAGSYRCECPHGMRVAHSDSKTCEDVDECVEHNGACAHECVNAHGSYECRCRRGFQLADDMRACHGETLSVSQNIHRRKRMSPIKRRLFAAVQEHGWITCVHVLYGIRARRGRQNV